MWLDRALAHDDKAADEVLSFIEGDVKISFNSSECSSEVVDELTTENAEDKKFEDKKIKFDGTGERYQIAGITAFGVTKGADLHSSTAGNTSGLDYIQGL